jgi:molybdopterin-binding protein
MTSYRIAEAADLVGVSDDTLRRWVEQGRLAAEAGPDGRLRVAGPELARFAQQLSGVGHEGATDRARAVSARNRLRGIVTRVTKDGVMAQVEMVCGPYRVVSLMSSEACEDLGLAPGVVAIASVKATNVVVELP